MTSKLIVLNGNLCWEDEDRWAHREDDRPAYVAKNGTVGYYHKGRLHREGNKPAWICPDLNEVKYYHHGKRVFPKEEE